MNKVSIFLVSMFFLASAAWAETTLPDAAQEARAQSLFHLLRCVVCEGQALAESRAELAGEMRTVVREFIAQGQSDEAILSYFRQRYGDEVITKPPLRADTYALWLAPPALILVALAGLIFYRQRRSG